MFGRLLSTVNALPTLVAYLDREMRYRFANDVHRTWLGMDPKVFAAIVNTSSGRCWSSDTYNPYPGVLENVPSSRGYSGGFGADLMLKDLTLVTEAAKTARQPVMLGALAQQIYQKHSVDGHGAKDFSSVILQYMKG